MFRTKTQRLISVFISIILRRCHSKTAFYLLASLSVGSLTQLFSYEKENDKINEAKKQLTKRKNN